MRGSWKIESSSSSSFFKAGGEREIKDDLCFGKKIGRFMGNATLDDDDAWVDFHFPAGGKL